jgi:hypothetical protein
MLRTSRTPLRWVWALAYRAVGALGAAYMARGNRGAAAYLRASFAGDDFLPGLSDVDVTLVLPDGGREPARDRWTRLRDRFPATTLVLDYPRVYGKEELRGLVGTSAYTYGLDARNGAGAGYFGEVVGPDSVRLLERPGLYSTTTEWSRLWGPDWRPAEPRRDRQAERIAAWLELVSWWHWAFPVCVEPGGPRTAHLCVKLVAEPARIWLWLAEGERIERRADVLERALRRLPEEETALRQARDLLRRLPRHPEPPLEDAIRALVRLSARIAALIAAELEAEGATEVRLAGGADADRLPEWSLEGPLELSPLPPGARRQALADWRSLVFARTPDESLDLHPGDPGDPATLGALAGRDEGPYPALARDGLLVLPAVRRWRTRLRAVKSAATDPVSFALMEGSEVARFPRVAGWSAHDVARRALAEHGSWLCDATAEDLEARFGGSGPALAMLLSAARAGLFLESLGDGVPELALTGTETARRLRERDAAISDEALGHYREFAIRCDRPPMASLSALCGLVQGLPAYARSAPPASSPARGRGCRPAPAAGRRSPG